MFEKSSVHIFLIVICNIFAVVFAYSVSTDIEECPKICPLLYSPLCATNGTDFKQFDNECSLKVNNCLLERSDFQKYRSTDMDFCKTELVDSLSNLLKKLDNLDMTIPQCLKPCTMIYSPVCASNGKYRVLISNKCILETFNCVLDRKDIKPFKVLQEESCY